MVLSLVGCLNGGPKSGEVFEWWLAWWCCHGDGTMGLCINTSFSPIWSQVSLLCVNGAAAVRFLSMHDV